MESNLSSGQTGTLKRIGFSLQGSICSKLISLGGYRTEMYSFVGFFHVALVEIKSLKNMKCAWIGILGGWHFLGRVE